MKSSANKDKLNFDITNVGKQRRIEHSTIGIVLFTVAMFGVFFGLIFFSLYTRQRESYFLRQVGVNLTGDLDVSSSNQGQHFPLNER
ncbi:MAG: hypothetical protein MJ107_08110, partial [Lachnospiraceae bacterium]|nr:hypothetical protein [Lachnospiraceae bacterium]